MNSFFLILFIIAIGYCDAKDACEKFLGELADSQRKFVYCSTMNSVPVTLCESCNDLYDLTEKQYEIIIKNETCFKKYFDQDRVNIVSTVQNILTGLWDKAYCKDCLNTNNSKTFNNNTVELETCLSDHKGNECVFCLRDYTTLNNFYIELEKNNNGKICYDMQDSMNRTRELWSKQLKCCKRSSDLTAFIIAVSVIASLPVIFYSATYAVTKRQEQNHGILNEEEPQLETPTTSNLIAAAVIATPDSSNKKTIADSDSDSDNTDDGLDFNKTKKQ